MSAFTKRNPAAPPGFFAWEAAGLGWLADAPGGVPCARVLRCDDTSLTLQRLQSAPATAAAAVELGRRLAVTHDAGADGFGAAPQGWIGPGFFGPLHHPLPMSLTPHESWGRFYAEEIYRGYQSVYRLAPHWPDRRALHQLYPLLAHVVLFGAGYAGQTAAAARATLSLM